MTNIWQRRESTPSGAAASGRHARAARLTPAGRGAIATLRLEGKPGLLDGMGSEGPLCIARNEKPFAALERGRVALADWGGPGGESVVICRIDDEAWEIHCHGGRAAVQRILQDLMKSGVEEAEPWSMSAEPDPLIRGGWEALSRASTLRTADLLLSQAAVEWPAALARWKQAGGGEAFATFAAESLQWENFGRHLTSPWRIALCGRPNAGKSSLMNALAGFQRSIVHDLPGTTRDIVTLETAFDGWPVQLIDTAGLRDADDEIEFQGVERARKAAADCDVALLVIDGSQPLAHSGPDLREALPEALVVWNKSDQGNAWGARTPQDAVCVSAKLGTGIEELARRLVAKLVPGIPTEGIAYPVCAAQREWLARIAGVPKPIG